MISVLMGIYNGQETLQRAIMSLLNGTYRDIEIIAVDDGSTDDSLQILMQIAKQDKRLKVFSYSKNHGLAYALNFALANAKGQYVARMDADDISHKERLEKQLSYLQQNPQIDFCGCCANIVDSDGIIWGGRRFPEFVDKNIVCKYNPFIHPTLLFNKKVLLEVSGYRDEPWTNRCEDYDLIFRLYAKGFVGQNLQEVLLDYYESKDSAKRHNKQTRHNEYVVRKEGVKTLKGGLKGKLYTLKPLLLSKLSDNLYNKLHNKNVRK